MTDTHESATQTIRANDNEHGAMARVHIAERMKNCGYGAVLWSESVFGSTGLPLLTVSATERYEIYGLRLGSDGAISAIISPVPSMHEQEATGLDDAEAAKLIAPDMTMVGGTPEEWEILAACLDASLPVLNAEKKDEQPLPWW